MKRMIFFCVKYAHIFLDRMEKEEESEKHLQDILDAQSNATATHTTAEIDTLVHLVIPIPEVFEGDAQQVYKDVYAGNYKVRPFLHYLLETVLICVFENKAHVKDQGRPGIIISRFRFLYSKLPILYYHFCITVT